MQPSNQQRPSPTHRINICATVAVAIHVQGIGNFKNDAGARTRRSLALSGSTKAGRKMRYCTANATCLGTSTRNNNSWLDKCRAIGSFGAGRGQHVQGTAQPGNHILVGIWGKRSSTSIYLNTLPHQSSSPYGVELRRATATRHTLHARNRNSRSYAAFNGSGSRKCQTGKRYNYSQNGKELADRVDMVSVHTAHSHSIRTSLSCDYSLPLALPFVGIRPPKTLLLGICDGGCGGGVGFESLDKVSLLESVDKTRMGKKGGLGNQFSHMGGVV